MHVLLWSILLLLTHIAAFVLGMIYKGRVVAQLQAENLKLRSAAAGIAAKGIDKL